MNLDKLNFSPSSELSAETSGKYRTVYVVPKTNVVVVPKNKRRCSLRNHLWKLVEKIATCSPNFSTASPWMITATVFTFTSVTDHEGVPGPPLFWFKTMRQNLTKIKVFAAIIVNIHLPAWRSDYSSGCMSSLEQ